MTTKKSVLSLILQTNVIILFIIIVLNIFNGFDDEEFGVLIGLLGPIIGIYLGTVFNYIGKSIKKEAENLNFGKYHNIVYRIILGHFVLITSLIISYAVFNLISFSQLMIFLGLIETAFGIHIGALVTTLFDQK